MKGASLEVIEANCISVLRRLNASPAQLADTANEGWQLDARSARLQVPIGTTLELTHMEAVFLRTLMNTPGAPVAHEQLLAEIGRANTYNKLCNLDNCATRLRRKVQASTGLELPVRACYGQGYAFGEAAKVDKV